MELNSASFAWHFTPPAGFEKFCRFNVRKLSAAPQLPQQIQTGAVILVLWICNTKMNISQPIASHIGSVEFGRLSPEEIRAFSVKKIVNPTTFDTLLHPVPGGLYDAALGAWGDIP